MTASARDDGSTPPAPPDGYRPPEPFGYPMGVLFVVVAAVLVAAAGAFGALLWTLQGPAVVHEFVVVASSADAIAVTVDAARLGVVLLGAIAVVTAVHELVHGAAYRLLGYDVTYGTALHLGAFYVAAFDQFQTRRDSLLVALAPLVALTLALAPLLAAPAPRIAAAAYVGIVFNAAGSAGDLYLAWRLRRDPPGTLYYDADSRRSWVYEPADT